MKFSFNSMTGLLALLSVIPIATPARAAGRAACPRLEGSYACSGNTKYFVGSTEVRQALENGAVRFWLPWTGNPGNPQFTRLADGRTQVRIERESHVGDMQIKTRTACAGNRLIDNVIMRPATPLPIQVSYSMRTLYELGAAGDLKVTEKFVQVLNGRPESRIRVSFCRRQ